MSFVSIIIVLSNYASAVLLFVISLLHMQKYVKLLRGNIYNFLTFSTSGFLLGELRYPDKLVCIRETKQWKLVFYGPPVIVVYSSLSADVVNRDAFIPNCFRSSRKCIVAVESYIPLS